MIIDGWTDEYPKDDGYYAFIDATNTSNMTLARVDNGQQTALDAFGSGTTQNMNGWWLAIDLPDGISLHSMGEKMAYGSQLVIYIKPIDANMSLVVDMSNGELTEVSTSSLDEWVEPEESDE